MKATEQGTSISEPTGAAQAAPVQQHSKPALSPSQVTGLLLRLAIGGLFFYSGGIKLLDPAAFQIDVANFELIPWSLTGFVAVYLPWVEVLCGAALIAKRQLHGSVLILSLLMVLFILLVASAWARGLDVTCGCFGVSDSGPDYPLWIARNLAILAALLAIPWLDRKTSPAR